MRAVSVEGLGQSQPGLCLRVNEKKSASKRRATHLLQKRMNKVGGIDYKKSWVNKSIFEYLCVNASLWGAQSGIEFCLQVGSG